MNSRKRKASNAPRSISVGLDFGTTYSGIAWGLDEDDINVISNYSSYNFAQGDKKKVLTTLLYGHDGISWGYRISPKDVPLKWFKLLLLDEEDLPDYIRDSHHIKEAKRQMQSSNRHAVEVIGDFLRQLWGYGIEEMERSMGKRQVASLPFHLIVTVPAIWPLYARNRMQQALVHAGILSDKVTLDFVSEPEAAAVAVMRDSRGRASIKKNDHFVVCDAGGGTVLRESVKGDGILRGAICLDERFQELLKSKVPANDWQQLGRAGIHQLIERYWEHGIKTDHIEDMEVGVPVSSGQTSFNVKISKQEIADIYKPIVADIVDLVCKQMFETKGKFNKVPDYVFLVGGFGKSRVLYKALTDAIFDHGFPTEVMQPQGDKPWTAVCRGALLRGLSQTCANPWATVDARVARASYGTTVNILPWTMGEHDARDREWCPLEREYLAVNQVQWFITMGETLGINSPVAKAFWQDVESPEEEITTEIVISTATPPPYRFAEDVSRLCAIRWAKIPNFDSLPSFTNSAGNTVRQIPYEIKMVPNGMSLDFEIFFKDIMVASKNISIECDQE
ncbi:hypothetical protein CP533_2260 [Ophiocordyceps camponoti-saundersi (nom. inval.)]|nr:hypothetical protein CP533_2260 [Ophiocordyceps camponoti-saundersi (nom. inval.)]